MKVIQSSFVRALCAIVVGALLVKYRQDMVTWLTITIGVIFFISGVISCVTYLAARRHSSDVDIRDAEGNRLTTPAPSFPLVGIGSLILGALLAMMPQTFVNGLTYVLAAILILGALNQFFNLATATKFARIGLIWWVLPAIIFIIGLIALVKPSVIATAPLFVIGWCMMVYGVVELINTLKIHRCRKAFEKIQQQLAAEAQAQESTDASDSQPTA